MHSWKIIQNSERIVVWTHIDPMDPIQWMERVCHSEFGARVADQRIKSNYHSKVELGAPLCDHSHLAIGERQRVSRRKIIALSQCCDVDGKMRESLNSLEKARETVLFSCQCHKSQIHHFHLQKI